MHVTTDRHDLIRRVRMDVRTQTIKYFVAVAEDMSFSLAADRLGVSQPAISRQVRLLEDDLGTPLFIRTNREVRLTAAGAAFLQPARELLATWESAQRIARGAAVQADRVLRVALPTTGAGPLPSRAKATFAEGAPEVTVRMEQYGAGGEVAALRQGRADVAFFWLPADTTGLVAEVLAEEPRAVGVATFHHLAERKEIYVADLH